ncbi:MAG: hypothetical protein AABX16_03470 [Nanoarchaeota archaeon]
MMMKKKSGNGERGEVSLQFLFWLIVAVIVLVISVVAIIYLTQTGQNALSFIKDFIRGG